MSTQNAQSVMPPKVDEAFRDVTVLDEGNVPGGVVPFNEVRTIVEQLVELRVAAANLLRRLDKMGGSVYEGHSKKCRVWSGETCSCAIGQHIKELQKLLAL